MACPPLVIRCDHGQESISAVTSTYASKRGVRVNLIQPGQPKQSAYFEPTTAWYATTDWPITCLKLSIRFRLF